MGKILVHQKKACQIGQRASFGLAALKVKDKFKDLTIFSADTHTSAGLQRFSKRYPESLFDVSIAEQSLVGISSGYALSGGKTIATTFAPFITMRPYELIRHCMGYMKSPLTIVGLASGVEFGQLGYTHCCIEDTAIMLSIPSVDIYSPIDPSLIEMILNKTLLLDNPTYIRTTGEPGLEAINLDNPIEDGSMVYRVIEGTGNLVLSTGAITSYAQKAIRSLNAKGANISLYGINKIRPLNLKGIEKELLEAKFIYILEEGLSTGLYSHFLRSYPSLAGKSIPICHPDHFLKPGNYMYMLKQAKLDIESLKSRIS